MSQKTQKQNRKNTRKAIELMQIRSGKEAERLVNALMEQSFWLRLRFCVSVLFSSKLKESK